MTFRRWSPDQLTVRGWPAASTTTSEQVASKPTPLTAEAGSAASARAARTEVAQAAQISSEDCSATLPASCHTVIGCRAVASRIPFSSNIPARALDVPTSTPTKACCIWTPLKDQRQLTSTYNLRQREQYFRSSGWRRQTPGTGRPTLSRRPPPFAPSAYRRSRHHTYVECF